MKQEIKEVIIGLLVSVFICVIFFLILISAVKETNEKRYLELPKINIVEEKVEDYLASNEPFNYIKYEFVEENILCYYFEKDGNYFKAIYRFKEKNFPGYKYWAFDKIVIAFEAEVLNEED